ncbi:MAG: hypothetical protein A3B91_03185 [Candidatus Yanofskybacteria bacterium RIFCSPHIGHO2_02_FULL_41_29]|uniref:Methyltransferase domain-containing protein n=1 Tax=Candidatus Yanofskybacteria bacterium RIFCSPHIGHO2_01_FULL_41_53 TaxID=1802663 RepID=A0A1F8EMF4_9BACT|nr:MAG: hypothetical protein A2650_02400 [Candidatus Yanofskybacteria bacterium RIFCSPHIGHO2_01_FULL_41_53]OGN10667.1 MAG: hypothetical protein A3B91_03185 [Candidatus Yanofskybacteria bacterium RIFCSPHIGHO2_02_FULL_41_29]OGN18115.1 MAG: hypothetical protein A3F48_02200 [Candidatus Yanofskybacteria bacterium RIFCSPHIGHO2_12_FULL_41_9]OGN23849.1 MAG: hypothetical protein A2916_04575 [Candidatus Yanofskybacteria bacterium RIFCSPLOWO2_01_FULL_41_67]OGN30466.1 MAG: hypothetical protein A3H54_00355 
MAKDLDRILNDIPGFLSKREADFLYDVVRKNGGTIVEIGSLYGRSTVVLADALKNSDKKGRVYAIDPQYFDDLALGQLKSNLNKHNVDGFVEVVVATSEEASKNWNKPVDFLWIDGDHTYKMAETDFLLWEPYLREGGIIAYHDATFNYPDVRKVVSRYILRSRKFRNAGFIDNILFATKCRRSSLKDAVESLYTLSLKNMVTSSIYIKPPRFIKELVKPLVRKFSRSNYK